MVWTEVLSEARLLSRPEQLRLIQELSSEVLRAESDETLIVPGQDYPVWSPDSAFDAAVALQRALDLPETRP